MKIVYLYPSLAIWGGIERVLINKMNWLAKAGGYEVYVLTTNQGEHAIPYPLDERVHYEDLQVRTHLQYRYHGLRRYWEHFSRGNRLRKLLEDRIASVQPDIVVTAASEFVGAIQHLHGSFKLVVESHDGYGNALRFEHTGFLRRYMINRSYRDLQMADILVALTESDAQLWRQRVHRVEVIPDIVNLNTSKKISTLENKRALFVGRLVRQKGADDLLAIWKLVQQRHPDWHLDIYGEGELLQQIEQEAARMNVNAEIHPPVADIMNCYLESSMLLLTSLYEPFGLVMPEAMSCGLPVVAFDCPFGPAEIITDGKDGFLVKDRSTEVFANRVCQLIEDIELRRSMGQAAVRSSQQYSSDRIMPLWQRLFEDLTR